MIAVDINVIDGEGDSELFARFGFDGIKVVTLFSDDLVMTDGWLADGFDIVNNSGNCETVNGDNGLDFLKILKQVFDGFYMRAGEVYDLTEQEIKKKVLEYGTAKSEGDVEKKIKAVVKKINMSEEFDPDQARDSSGRWASSGAAASGELKITDKNVLGLADKIRVNAVKVEPQITKDMESTVKESGVELVRRFKYGVSTVLKTRDSIARKIVDDIMKNNPGLTAEQAAAKVKDVIRYSVADEGGTRYVPKIMDFHNKLVAKGYVLLDVPKNYFNPSTEGFNLYRGINCKYKNKEGIIFEVQYHTKESIVIVEKNHAIYEKQRLSRNARMVEKLNGRMAANCKHIRTPPRAARLFADIKIGEGEFVELYKKIIVEQTGMRYFFYLADKNKVESVRRLDMDSDPIVLERWNGTDWEWWPTTMDAVSPYSSDQESYREVSKDDSDKFIEKITKKESFDLVKNRVKNNV